MQGYEVAAKPVTYERGKLGKENGRYQDTETHDIQLGNS